MNPTNIIQDIYDGKDKTIDTSKQEEASAAQKLNAAWKHWNTNPITNMYQKAMLQQFQSTLSECCLGVMSGQITDAQLRSKVASLATISSSLNLLENGPTTNTPVEVPFNK
jgi:hypothetical protein